MSAWYLSLNTTLDDAKDAQKAEKMMVLEYHGIMKAMSLAHSTASSLYSK